MPLTRRVLALAIPAFATLIAQPLMMLADTWIVGQLGTEPLAGLGVGATLLAMLTGLMIFLAYGSTATVSRQIGAGNQKKAMELGIQALWLGLGFGFALAVVMTAGAPWFVSWLGASGEVARNATIYLRWVVAGLPGMLLALAATGTFRGMADAKTPLLLMIGAATSNFILNVVFVFGLRMNIHGAGLGTAIAETTMGLVAALLILIRGHKAGASLRPRRKQMVLNLRVGTPLILRTVSLRLALLLTTYVAAKQGSAALAAYHVSMQLWNFLANALDAIAIAGQTIIGIALGAGNRNEARIFISKMTRWAVGLGCGLGLILALAREPVAAFFAPETEVFTLSCWVFVVMAASLPLAGYVFLLDGVLIGAGDGTYLARAGIVALLGYLPILFSALLLSRGFIGLLGVFLAFCFGYMGLRAITLGSRARNDTWMRLGAH